MIRRNAKYLVLASMIAFAANGNAGTGTVSPALAACSKALIETLAKSDTLPTYTVKAPSVFVSDMVDPYAYTVIAKSTKTKAVLAKASCKTNPEGEIVAFRTLKIS
jgi:glutamine synthetase adenylyltransferase